MKGNTLELIVVRDSENRRTAVPSHVRKPVWLGRHESCDRTSVNVYCRCYIATKTDCFRRLGVSPCDG